MKNYYKCECGKEFDNPQKFNGHKSSCQIHLANKGISYNQWISEKRKQREHQREVGSKNRAINKQLILTKWLDEKHICENCGKIMTEKFGSGRFCSRSCANSNHKSKDNKNKVKGLIISSKLRSIASIDSYNKNPKLCACCGKKIPYQFKYRKYCSKKCSCMNRSDSVKKSINKKGPRNIKGVKGTSRYGVYKGIECDSSWELAYVVYNLDHNISFSRNKKSFSYKYNGEEHYYFPDFIEGNTYIEIKNYLTDSVQAKIDYFPKDINYKILFKKDIQKYIDYCVEHYGKNYAELLYDKNLPNYYSKNKKL